MSSLRGSAQLREAAAQGRDDVLCVVDGERGLRDVGKAQGVGRNEGLGVFHRLDQRHGARADLSHRADNFGVALHGL